MSLYFRDYVRLCQRHKIPTFKSAEAGTDLKSAETGTNFKSGETGTDFKSAETSNTN